MDSSDAMEDVDLTLRHVSRRFPEQLARALLPPGSVITAAHWPDTQLTARQRRLDRALEVTANGEQRLFHTEWQLDMDADVPFRMFEYHALFALALAAEAAAGGRPPPIDSVLVLLSGREKPWPAEGEYRTSSPGAPFSGVRYRIEAVYQRTVTELTARGPLWAIFAPLAVDADPGKMKQVVEDLRATVTFPDFRELGTALAVIADVDKRHRGLEEAIIPMLGEEVVMQSSIYKLGEEKGIEKGIEPMMRLFARKIGRPLAASERASLLQRLDTLGPDRLLDVGLALSADALSAWLADPTAT